MKRNNGWFLPTLFMLISATNLVAQHKAKPATLSPNKVIFAVLNDGKAIEPVAKIENGKLMQSVSGGDDLKILTAFNKTYYAPKTVYNLIFGGVVAGTVTVVKNDPKQECTSNLAEVISKPTRAKLKGFVMALATNLKPTKATSGMRRPPTADERADIEKLAAAEFVSNKISAKAFKSMNLTAVDVNNDKIPEFVGTYWVTTSPTERDLLFFIADKGANGKYSIGYKDFRKVKKDEVMSGEIKSLDEGVYQELLLETLDYNDDGIAEIFTYAQGFEGASFSAYQLKGGKWDRILEASNYHCGY